MQRPGGSLYHPSNQDMNGAGDVVAGGCSPVYVMMPCWAEPPPGRRQTRQPCIRLWATSGTARVGRRRRSGTVGPVTITGDGAGATSETPWGAVRTGNPVQGKRDPQDGPPAGSGIEELDPAAVRGGDLRDEGQAQAVVPVAGLRARRRSAREAREQARE